MFFSSSLPLPLSLFLPSPLPSSPNLSVLTVSRPISLAGNFTGAALELSVSQLLLFVSGGAWVSPSVSFAAAGLLASTRCRGDHLKDARLYKFASRRTAKGEQVRTNEGDGEGGGKPKWSKEKWMDEGARRGGGEGAWRKDKGRGQVCTHTDINAYTMYICVSVCGCEHTYMHICVYKFKYTDRQRPEWEFIQKLSDSLRLP